MSISAPSGSTSSASSSLMQPILNVGGLASGLDTSSIISQLMAIERQPRDALAAQATLAAAKQSVLSGFQTQMRAVEAAAQDLRSVTLWSQQQSASSSDPSRISASIVSGAGAGIGGYQVAVSQLANSAQRTYSFVSPSTAGTITIDGHATNVAAGASIDDVVSAINGDSSATVYAAATDSGTLVLSGAHDRRHRLRLHPGDRLDRLADRADGEGQAGPGRALHRRRGRRLGLLE